jgi:hypothetical protein
MRVARSASSLLVILAGLCAGGCANARKKTGEPIAVLNLPVATPLSEAETVAALKAIADSANANLPKAPEGEAGDPTPTDRVIEETGATGETSSGIAGLSGRAPRGWKSPGLDPEGLNPGDVFSDQRGPYLRKVMSLLDELPPKDRNPLLNAFAVSTTARVPLTLSRSELAELARNVPAEVELPTRNVALDFRKETHTVDPNLFAALLNRIESGESAGTIAPEARLAALRKQIAEVKRILRDGGTLHLVTSVGESSVVDATYPGAPVGKRDATPIRNAVEWLYPHSGEVSAEKTADRIELSGSPRIVWDYEVRELRLEGDRLVPGSAPFAGR